MPYPYPPSDRPDPLPVGPAVTQVLLLIALLAGPFFFLGDLAFENGIRLVILYTLFQATGHVSQYIYSIFSGESTVSRTFVEGKPEYTWIAAFLSQSRLRRKFRFRTAVVGGPESLVLGRVYKLRWNKVNVEVIRTEDTSFGYDEQDRPSLLEIKIHTYDDSAMNALVDEAKTRYMNSHSSEATVRTIGVNTSWGNPAAKWNQTRKVSALSLALPVNPEVMDSLYSEAREFFDSEAWYTAAGLSWKKSILLHGVPTTKPLDVVLSLGAKLRRDVYHLNFLASDNQCTNSYLLQALGSVPAGSIFVIENIDQAYFKNLTGSCSCCPPSGGAPSYLGGQELKCLVTPHGVLDCLRGLARGQGILLVATAATKAVIPEHLFGNGLIDRSIECTLAVKDQVVSLFNKFFPTSHGIPHGTTFNNDLKVPLLPDLAEEFARQIPEYTFSLTELQQYLIPHKSSPAAAVAGIGKWVDGRMNEMFPPRPPYIINPVYTPYWQPADSNPYAMPPRRVPTPPSPAWSPPPHRRRARTPVYSPRSPAYSPPPPQHVVYNPPPPQHVVYSPPSPQHIPCHITPQGGWNAAPPPRPYSPVWSPRPTYPITASPPSPGAPYIPGVTGITTRTPSPEPLPPVTTRRGWSYYEDGDDSETRSSSSRTPSPPPAPRPASPGWIYYGNEDMPRPVSPQYIPARAYTPTILSERHSPAPSDSSHESDRTVDESGQGIQKQDE